MREVMIALSNQIPSGKNQQLERWVESPKLYGNRIHKIKKKVLSGNPRFTAWKNQAAMEIMLQKRTWAVDLRMALPLKCNLRMTVHYHPLDKTVRDVCGMCDAIQHLLEHMEIIENDKQIKSLYWPYPYDTTGPCAIVKLEEL